MKVSVEVPIHHLKDFDDLQDYIFILAHLCTNPTYKEYVKSSKKLKILDNSAFELGGSVDPIFLCDLAEELGVDVIVVPDVLNNTSETLKATEKFYTEFLRRKSKVKTMIVPQGYDLSEFCMCLYKMLVFPFDIVGVSYVTPPGLDPESQRLKKVEYVVNITSKDVHLLGLCRPSFLFEYKKYVQIKSIDTSLPVVYAYYNKAFTSTSFKEERPSSFFDIKFSDEQLELAKRNITVFKSLAT